MCDQSNHFNEMKILSLASKVLYDITSFRLCTLKLHVQHLIYCKLAVKNSCGVTSHTVFKRPLRLGIFCGNCHTGCTTVIIIILFPYYFVSFRFSRRNRLFAGLWFGNGKPHFPTFLKPFAQSRRKLYVEGTLHGINVDNNPSMLHCKTPIPSKTLLKRSGH